jgi:hypothetical protein
VKIRKPCCKPSKKQCGIALGVIVVIAIVVVGVHFLKGDANVKFNVLSEEQYPAQLAQEIIPEYKQMERALACIVDDKIYVIATRGEKPTAGYEIAIDKMKLAKENDSTKLYVYANFTDPQPGAALAQTLSYPFQAVATELTELPAEIELRVQYTD